MMGVMVAGLMWGLVLVLSLRARRRPDNTLLWSAIIIAASMTTNVSELYLWVASWLPWPNALDLVANILLIAGVYHLATAIRRGATAVGMEQARGSHWTRGAAIGAIVAMVGAFAFIEAPAPSTTFMLDYGNQPSAAAYSVVQYVFICAVMLGTLATCVRNVPQMTQARFRAGFSVIGVGCAAAVLLCVSVVAMDLAHVAGEYQLMRALGGIYDVLFLMTMVLLCVGLGIPPLARQISSRRLRASILVVEPEIRRIWGKTVAKNPSVSLVGSSLPGASLAQALGIAQATDNLHRMVVEIHDWLTGQAESGMLSAEDWKWLGEAEALCLQRGEGS